MFGRFITHKDKEYTDRKGRRVGYKMFKGEKVKLRSITWGEADAINKLFQIEDVTALVTHFEGRLADKNVVMDNDVRWRMEDAMAVAYVNLRHNTDLAGWLIVKKVVQKPEKWFNTLTPAERDQLRVMVMAWSMYVDMNDLYTEILHDLVWYFNRKKGQSTFKGTEIAEHITKTEAEFLSLKKKPNCLNTVLHNALTIRVTDAALSQTSGPSE